MKRALILILVCIVLSDTAALAQRRRRSTPRRSTATQRAAQKAAAEVQAGRKRVAAQIKTLTHFLYLLGGIAKGMESVEQASRNNEVSSVTIAQNEQTKAKVKESIRNVRAGLDKIEADFRFNPALKKYYPQLSGVAVTAEMAERQAAANRFDEAGRTLLKVVNQLADALAA
ncbi:MAG TPA: hypothetical protein VNO14_10835, partial [Blastocatellia bacterium]|nr:hypothetical protein [Blastocatellia bacterium]